MRARRGTGSGKRRKKGSSSPPLHAHTRRCPMAPSQTRDGCHELHGGWPVSPRELPAPAPSGQTSRRLLFRPRLSERTWALLEERKRIRRAGAGVLQGEQVALA